MKENEFISPPERKTPVDNTFGKFCYRDGPFSIVTTLVIRREETFWFCFHTSMLKNRKLNILM